MLEIRLLGQFEVRRGGEALEITSRPSRLLLAYLALTAGKHHPREKLAGLLWPESDESSARSNLRQALWRLRKSIGDHYLLVDTKTVAINPNADYWLDTALLAGTGEQDLIEVASVYEGELLPGYYEDWVILERERLQAAFERAMGRLLESLIQRELWPDVLRWAEHWIAFGQVPEPAYRALMVAHVAQGDLAAAISAYERCAAALQLEVGVEPSTETRRLYDHLLQGEEPFAAPLLGPEERLLKENVSRHNLPHQSTAFIGRERELAQVRRLLSEKRLLTIVGPGGTGKTRLALQTALEKVGEYEDGVYFVSLAPIESPDSIARTIAEAIGFPLSSQEDPQWQLLRHLKRRQYLLVLDNFEHLLPGATLVAEILQQAGQVTLLATSRERLSLREETLFKIEGLAYPSSSFTADGLDYGAVQLFVDGARRLQPDFDVTPESAPHIAQICRLLEGMPLGILLAAAWVDVLTAKEIAAEISQSLDFLQAKWPDAPSRHHSVRAAFEPSWQQLTNPQRELFAGLAIFRGGFSQQAAKKVARASLRELAGLVNKSLLRRNLDTGRYEVHELLRQFAQEHLEAMPHVHEGILKAHAAYFAEMMQQQWELLIGRKQRQALVTIEADLDNLRRAWHYWLKQRNAGQVKKFLAGFWRFYDLRGWFNTGAAFFGEAAISMSPEDEEATDDEMKTVYAELLGYQAYFMAQLGYSEEGFAQARESVTILRRLKRPIELAFPLTILNWNAAYITDPLQATKFFVLDEVKFPPGQEGQWRQAYVGCWKGRGFVWRGEYEQGRQQVENSLLLFEELGDELATVWPRLELGDIAIWRGSYSEAQKYFIEVLRISREHNFDWAIVKATRYLANIATLLGQFEQAKEYNLTSLRLADELGMIRDLVSTLYDIALVEAESGDKETAACLLMVVRQHPLSNQTRTFSIWLGDSEARFRNLAQAQMEQLQRQMPADAYAKSLEEGRTLDLDTVVAELLNK